MCQYAVRCPVGHHKPGTVCRYRTTALVPRYSPPQFTRAASTTFASGGQSSQFRTRYGAGATAAGLDLFEIAAWLILASMWNGRVSPSVVATIAVLVLAPVLFGVSLVWTCTAWNRDGGQRCGNRRPGVFRRCELPAHISQRVTFNDLVAGLSWLVGAGLLVAALALL